MLASFKFTSLPSRFPLLTMIPPHNVAESRSGWTKIQQMYGNVEPRSGAIVINWNAGEVLGLLKDVPEPQAYKHGITCSLPILVAIKTLKE